MRDEEYAFYQDLREKKVTGHSARKKRSHCGKGGRVKFPSDYLTKKEIKNMSGECKSYRLNEPIGLAEFRTMPDDIKILYINAIREKYNAPNVAIAQMLGTNKDILYRELKRLDMAHGRKGAKKWDSEGFFNWWKGIPTTKECQSVQKVAAEDMTVEEAEVVLEILGEAVPAETEQEVIKTEDTENDAREAVVLPRMAIPTSGSMNFEGDAYDILKTVGVLLGGAKVKLCVSWEV